jgi:threonine/homoserine/homoserine lactone efflux protein
MSLLLAMVFFSLTMSISPGPVNMISLSIGLNHGFRRALPFVTGATLGFTVMLGLVGLGLGPAISATGGFYRILSIAGTAFVAYLGYQIAVSTPERHPSPARAPGFNQGVVLQWINPKAWSACLAGISAFHVINDHLLLATFTSLYFVICLISIGSWALAGAKLKRLFHDTRRLRMVNIALGGGLIGVALYLLRLNWVW